MYRDPFVYQSEASRVDLTKRLFLDKGHITSVLIFQYRLEKEFGQVTPGSQPHNSI